MKLTYDPAIPLLGIYPDKIVIQKDTRSSMFIAPLYTLARNGSNLNVHQQKKKRIQKMWCVHTHTHIMEYYSAIKMYQNCTFTDMCMGLENVIQSPV